MALQAEDKLEKLRQRATCPICKEFYDTPRKLNNCSHVFCLQCLRTHLRLNVGVNFPKCPMCRKPMSNPLSEIHKYETARAEEDIVEFVKQYETCDICENKENPNVKCLECNWYICKNCIPSHSKLKPTHQTEPIIATKNYKRSRTKNICEKHLEQTKDLFCFVCQKNLCWNCERFSHSECKVRGSDKLIQLMFSEGFLQYYVERSEERKLEFRNGALSRIVYLADFVEAAEAWLQTIQREVGQCLEVFDVYQTQLSKIDDEVKTSANPSLTARVTLLLEETKSIVESGKAIHFRISRLLQKPCEYDIATSVLDIERKAFRFFKIRSEMALECCPIKFKIEDICSSATILRQVSKSCIQECNGKYAGMIDVPYDSLLEKVRSLIQFRGEEVAFDNCHRLNVNNNDTGSPTDLNLDKNEENAALSLSNIILSFTSAENEEDSDRYYALISRNWYFEFDIPYSCDQNYEYLNVGNFKHQFKQTQPIAYQQNRNLTYIDNNLYSNIVLQRAGAIGYVQSSVVNDIRSGYVKHFNDKCQFDLVCTSYVKETTNNNPLIAIAFGLPFRNTMGKVITNFTNVIITPVVFDVHGKWRKDRHYDSGIACFLGNRNLQSGLETVFMYLDREVDHTYGVRVNTGKAIFRTSETLNLYRESYPPTLSGVTRSLLLEFTKNRTDMFNILTGYGNKFFTLSYRSKQTESMSGEETFVLINAYSETGRNIPVTGIQVSLLCSLNQGLYCAKFDTELEFLLIERLTFTSKGVNTEVVYTLKDRDINAPVSKLKPLTMVEDRKESVVLVCGMEDVNDTFVMIWPDSSGSGKVEIFQIQDTPPNLSGASVIDLEMDQDGNIVYILETREGKIYSEITRYIMPSI